MSGLLQCFQRTQWCWLKQWDFLAISQERKSVSITGNDSESRLVIWKRKTIKRTSSLKNRLTNPSLGSPWRWLECDVGGRYEGPECGGAERRAMAVKTKTDKKRRQFRKGRTNMSAFTILSWTQALNPNSISGQWVCLDSRRCSWRDHLLPPIFLSYKPPPASRIKTLPCPYPSTYPMWCNSLHSMDVLTLEGDMLPNYPREICPLPWNSSTKYSFPTCSWRRTIHCRHYGILINSPRIPYFFLWLILDSVLVSVMLDTG